MTPQEFAGSITGKEYPFSLTSEERELAKANRLLVLWGQSDDLLELDGITRDEAGAWNGVMARVDPEGVLPISKDGTLLSDEPTTIQECIVLADRYRQSWKVKAEWCPEGTNLSWEISVDDTLDQAEFMVLEDGKPMCKGVVALLPND